MGLDQYTQQIIKSIAESNMREARKWAVVALNADTTQKNRWFVNQYKSILTSEGSNMIELPSNLKDIMICEDVSLSFKESRYYLSEKHRKISEEIFKMAKVSQKLLELQIPYKNATLLYGPPGTGKTMFGKYIAYKMGLPFCYLNISRLIDSYMGATSKNLAQAFTYASSNPCVFMLDEVDSISCNRSKGGNSGADKEMARITITLMQEFDKITNDVVVLAATNRLDIIDDAFVSRFSSKYEITPFSEEESLKMIDLLLQDIGMTIAPEEKLEIVRGGQEKTAYNTDQRMIMQRLVRKIADLVADDR